MKRVTPNEFEGTNEYSFSTDGKYARHTNSNINRDYNTRLVALSGHKKYFLLLLILLQLRNAIIL